MGLVFETTNPDSPFSSTSDLPVGTAIKWAVSAPNCMNYQSKLPIGEILCWSSQKHRNVSPNHDMTREPLLNCSQIINCSTGAGDPLETWYIPELRTITESWTGDLFLSHNTGQKPCTWWEFLHIFALINIMYLQTSSADSLNLSHFFLAVLAGRDTAVFNEMLNILFLQCLYFF